MSGGTLSRESARTPIRVHELSKTYFVDQRTHGAFGMIRSMVKRDVREIKAVDRITFWIAQGEIVGYVGPNGAGKSTTIKMLTGILMPSSGSIEILGLDPGRHRRQIAMHVGAVFGQRTQLWWDLPLIDSLELLRFIYRVPARRFQENLGQFRVMMELDEFLQTPVRQLSLGQRMRGELAAALLHDPSIVYLDEPTIGLDVVAKHRIREFLREINRERGVTVLLTTHDMSDIEQLCSRLMIIDRGLLLYDGNLEQIKQQFGTERTLIIELVDDQSVGGAIDVPFAREFRAEGPKRWLRFRREETTAANLIASVVARYQVRDLTVEEPAIESIVRHLYESSALSPAPLVLPACNQIETV